MAYRQKRRSSLLPLILILLGWVPGRAVDPTGPALYGQLNLDASWDRTIHLSYIPTFEDRYAMSQDMIIAEAAIDSLGCFRLDLGFLPDRDQLYRLHLVKRGNFPTTLTIGGQHENHLFLLANGREDIHLQATSGSPPFGTVTYPDTSLQARFQEVTDLVNQTEAEAAQSMAAKRQFMEQRLQEQLRTIGDTTSHPLISLYAIYLSQFESNHTDYRDFYQAYRQKWKDEDSAYFTAFRQKLPARINYLRIGGFVLGGIALIGLGFVLGRNRTPTNNPGLRDLTVQERKIYGLLRQGATNQEISEACHIGISTVKSHVSSIYRKLNVKSRKDILNL